MDKAKRGLKGSESRDTFKRKHKDLNPKYWATDADFCLVDKYPPGTVAYLDYKTTRDNVTFSETIQYNEWMNHAPVFIVQGDNPEQGSFTIMRYLGGDWRPNPPKVNLKFVTTVMDWGEFGEWEGKLRKEYRRRGGWKGCLKKNE